MPPLTTPLIHALGGSKWLVYPKKTDREIEIHTRIEPFLVEQRRNKWKRLLKASGNFCFNVSQRHGA